MSKDFRHGIKHFVPKSPKKGRRDELQEDNRAAKRPTERHIKDVLNRAVRHHDLEMFDEFDETDW